MYGAARDRRKMLWSFRALYELLDTCSFHSDVEDKREKKGGKQSILGRLSQVLKDSRWMCRGWFLDFM